jgi:DNA repair protein RAD7
MDDDSPDDVDEVDTFLSSFVWKPNSNSKQNKLSAISLADLCIQKYAKHLCVSKNDANLTKLPDLVKDKLALEIARLRALTPHIALSFVTQRSRILALPECSQLDDEFFISAVQRVADGAADDTRDLCVLQLRNAGFGLTDKVVHRTLSMLRALEIFQATGLYRISDEALAALLTTCRANLAQLDLTSCSRIGSLSLHSLDLSRLTSLILDHTPLTDEHVAILTNAAAQCFHSSSSSLPSTSMSSRCALETLSLVGLIQVTDVAVIPLLSLVGGGLQSLSLGNCPLLTDQSIVTVRTHCHQLRDLNISLLPLITAPALIGLFLCAPSSKSEEVNSPVISAPDSESTCAKMQIESIGRLENVNVFGLGNAVTDDGVAQLSLCGHHTLKHLNLSGCHLITSRSAVALSRYCARSLESLDVSFVRGLSEDALGLLVDSAPELKTLGVWGCTQLTTRFFEGISRDVTVSGRPGWI